MTERHEKSAAATAVKSRILLVDDHPILRQGLVRLIDREPDLVVCGEAESADEARELIPRTHPVLVLVDLSLRGSPGLELIKSINAEHPKVNVLVLSMHDEGLWAERALRAGACGYVMKQEKPRVLMSRIRQAVRGEMCVSERLAGMLLRKLTAAKGSNPTQNEDGLGDREMEVLQLIGQGLNTRDVAAAMHISVKTVEAHRENIKRKLSLSNINELMRYAVLRFSAEP